MPKFQKINYVIQVGRKHEKGEGTNVGGIFIHELHKLHELLYFDNQ